jgi:hypothetical protein
MLSEAKDLVSMANGRCAEARSFVPLGMTNRAPRFALAHFHKRVN